MTGDGVVVGPGAVEAIRRVGPTAWSVLTALAVHADTGDGSVGVRASVRSLAVELGLNKDTVARAIVRLRHAHLVTADHGPFQPGVYRLTVPLDVLAFTNAPALVAPRLPSRSRQRPASDGIQLTLLAAD